MCSSLAMDEQDVFGTPFPDWECNVTENYEQYEYGCNSSQSSWLFEKFQTIPHHTEQHSADRNGWQLYFPAKDMQSSRTMIKHIRCLEKHYQDFNRNYPLSQVELCKSFEFRLQLARNDPSLKGAWPTFEHDLKEYPDYTLSCIGLAMYRSVVAHRTARRLCSSTTEVPKIYPRLHYFGREKPISTIDVTCAGKLITVRGIIARATSTTYTCKCCTDKKGVLQAHEVGTKRRWTCSNCHVEGKRLNRKNTQRNITIQEMGRSSINDNSLDVKVPDEISTSLERGACVLVTGIVHVDTSNMYLQAVCIHINSTERSHDHMDEPKLTTTDLRAIREIQSDPLPFRLLVQSICPNLKGRVTIKAGLLLALLNTNSDTHVLLTSSDNIALRQLLEYCQSVSSKAAWLNMLSQKAELDVKRFKPDFDYLETDPLVLTGYDLCCVERIDNLDRLEPLEKILIDGASNLKGNTAHPARMTLLATASPNQGVFDARKPFMGNFTIPRAFMERFALVFLMEDTVDSENFIGWICPTNPSETKCSVEIPLVSQLKLQPGEQFDPLPIEHLRKYIDYARHHCIPEFTEESTKLLESFFSQMYSMPQWLNITNGMKMAQIQNMVRARARIDMSAEITVQHVMDTIRIVSRSWYDKYDTDDRDPVAKLPIKMGSLKAATLRQFLDVLRSQSEQLRCKLFTMKHLRQLMNEVGMPGVEDEIVEKLNLQGYLLKKSAGCYELLV